MRHVLILFIRPDRGRVGIRAGIFKKRKAREINLGLSGSQQNP